MTVAHDMSEAADIAAILHEMGAAARAAARELAHASSVDKNAAIGQLFGVTSTPTFVIVGPDGIVDSAVVSSQADFGRLIERKKKELLGTSGS